MCPAQSRLALLLSLMFLAGLAGCGQASSNNVSSLESHVNVSESPLSKQGLSPGNNSLTPVTPTTNPASIASGNKTDIVTGNGTDPRRDSPHAVPIPSNPADSPEPLGVPTWMAKDLASPDIATRLHALDVWAQSSPPGAVDPLILASEDKDERVRARAMELIEQDWARSADAEQSNEETDDTSGEAEDTNGITEAGDTGTLGEQSAIDRLKK
ncbi:MAG: hypothetical protein L0H94_06520 [Nitrospira sp.]|nr:hypothetical protein [Nitrospira sp.]